MNEEPDWLQRLRNEQLENYDRLKKLRKFLDEIGVEAKLSSTMIVLLKKQCQIMSEYDKVLCTRLTLVEVETYAQKCKEEVAAKTEIPMPDKENI